ncbi:MAG TPA: tetratricopeptide repeat protein [Candidatus Acidoferrales bacterium]|nr:tetratricopeptide repeat protein [Candidatus Acidoferrales bacterium]
MGLRTACWAVLLLAGSIAAVAAQAGDRIRAISGDELRRLFEAGNYREVQTASQLAVATAPQDAAAQYWLARSSYELGSYDAAMRAAEIACRLSPQNSEFQMWLGRAYGRKAEIESSFFLARKTRHAFETAVRLDGNNVTARRDLAEYYIEAPWFLGGSKDKARQQVQAIAGIDPLEGMLALAQLFRGLDQPEQARQQYELLLEKRPGRVRFYLEALDFYEHQRDSLGMARVLDRAHEVAPQDPRLLFYRAVSRVIGGLQLGQAEQELKEFLAQYPGNSDSVTQADGRSWLGTVYEGEGNWAAAVEQYRLAVQLEPYRKRFRKSLERAEKQLNRQGD